MFLCNMQIGEPRFYASVAFNGARWYLGNESQQANQNKQVFYYRGGGNGYSNNMFCCVQVLE